MTDNSWNDPSEPISQADLAELEQHLGDLARQVTAEDRTRIAEPSDLLEAIQTEAGLRQPEQAKAPRRWFALAAAVALLTIAGVAISNVATREDPVLIATTTISSDGLPADVAGRGEAAFLTDGTDAYLQLDLPELTEPATFSLDAANPAARFEVWLVDPSATNEPVSLGAPTASGRIDLPEGTEVEARPAVVISVEPDDGNPAPSGNFVLHGVLETVGDN